jgi:hypothetical protein
LDEVFQVCQQDHAPAAKLSRPEAAARKLLVELCARYADSGGCGLYAHGERLHARLLKFLVTRQVHATLRSKSGLVRTWNDIIGTKLARIGEED